MSKRSLTVNAILNLLKQSCSILFPLITFPYVSRVLGNDGFGRYNFAFSVADFFIIFAALGVSSYAIRSGAKIRDNKTLSQEFCSEVFSINVLSTVISAICLFLLLLIAKPLNSYTLLIVIIASQMILATLGADWINSIYEDYLYITVRYIAIQLIALVLIFMFVRSSSDVLAYAIIVTFASAGGNLINLFYIRKYIRLRFVLNKNVITHIKPVLLLFANAMAISLYVNADIVMLKLYRSDAEVGVYSLSSRIYNILKRLVNSVIVVSTPRLAFYLKNDKDKYRVTSRSIFNTLMIIAIPCAVGLIVMSAPIVRLVGDSEYADGWLPLSILGIAMLFALMASFYSNCVHIVFGNDSSLLLSTSISAAINILLNLIMLPLWGMYGAAITTVIAEFVNLVIQYTKAKPLLDSSAADISDLFKSVISSCMFAAVCILIVIKYGDSILSLAIGIPLSCVIYVVTSIVIKNKTLCSMMKTINGKTNE